MRLVENKHIKDIVAYARDQHGEKISSSAMSRHFQHVERFIKASVNVDKVRDHVIKEEIDKDIQASSLLVKNLGICSDMIQEYVERAKGSGDITSEEKNLRLWLGETRQTIELALRWRNYLEDTKKKTGDEGLWPKVERAIKSVLTPELATKFIEALEKQ